MRFWKSALLAGGIAVSVIQGAAAAPLSVVEAARDGDSAALTRLLASKPDLNATTADGYTALHWAVQNRDVASTTKLIKAGANINTANRYGYTPLMIAASSGDGAETALLLLKAGADVNKATPEGETPLMMAARTGDLAILKALLAAKADVENAEKWGQQTALMWASAEGHQDAVKQLIAAGAKVSAKSRSGYSPLLFAVRAGHDDVVKTLLDSGASVNEANNDGTSALLIATANSRFGLGMYLLDRGADPNVEGQGWGALHQVALVRSPHHQNVNPQRMPDSTLDSLDFVRALVKHGADVNARSKAAALDNFRNYIDRTGATPLWLAAKAVDVPLMKVLVELGADPSIKTDRGDSLLMTAAGIGYVQGQSPGTDAEALEAVKYAYQLGNSVNDVDKEGWTAMHGVAGRGSVEVVQFLYDKGAKLDVKTKVEGWTPANIADGVLLAGTFKRQLEAAALMKKLMAKDGIPYEPTKVIDPGTTQYYTIRQSGDGPPAAAPAAPAAPKAAAPTGEAPAQPKAPAGARKVQ